MVTRLPGDVEVAIDHRRSSRDRNRSTRDSIHNTAETNTEQCKQRLKNFQINSISQIVKACVIIVTTLC